jgi:hypothetical protein
LSFRELRSFIHKFVHTQKVVGFLNAFNAGIGGDYNINRNLAEGGLIEHFSLPMRWSNSFRYTDSPQRCSTWMAAITDLTRAAR